MMKAMFLMVVDEKVPDLTYTQRHLRSRSRTNLQLKDMNVKKTL